MMSNIIARLHVLAEHRWLTLNAAFLLITTAFGIGFSHAVQSWQASNYPLPLPLSSVRYTTRPSDGALVAYAFLVPLERADETLYFVIVPDNPRLDECISTWSDETLGVAVNGIPLRYSESLANNLAWDAERHGPPHQSADRYYTCNDGNGYISASVTVYPIDGSNGLMQLTPPSGAKASRLSPTAAHALSRFIRTYDITTELLTVILIVAIVIVFVFVSV